MAGARRVVVRLADVRLPDGDVLPLCRLRYGGSANTRAYAICRANHDGYQPAFLPSGYPTGAPEDPLDCACGFHDPHRMATR